VQFFEITKNLNKNKGAEFKTFYFASGEAKSGTQKLKML
jgi:hypothetical protein